VAHLDYYTTLEVSPSASDEEIKKSYRRLALLYHPDRNKDNPHYDEKIREINAAYEVLGHPETRKSYERLRFGGGLAATDGFGLEDEETVDPAVVFREMERKLRDEARKEMLSFLLKKTSYIKEELALLRERVIAKQGYDTLQQDIVRERAQEEIGHLLDAEAMTRREQLLEVALQMLLSQGVARSNDQEEVGALTKQLHEIYREGWVEGYTQACELFYVRR